MRNVMTSIATAGLLFVVAGCSSSPPRYGYAGPDAFPELRNAPPWVMQEMIEAQPELLESIAADRSVLVIEHDMEFVRQIARKVTVLHQGAVLAEGTPEQIADWIRTSRRKVATLRASFTTAENFDAALIALVRAARLETFVAAVEAELDEILRTFDPRTRACQPMSLKRLARKYWVIRRWDAFQKPGVPRSLTTSSRRYWVSKY